MTTRAPYCTPARYRELMGQPTSSGDSSDPATQAGLRRASNAIDEALITATYDTDILTGLPTDAGIAAVLEEATALQYEYQQEHGDTAGATQAPPQRVGPEVVGFLRTRGILNGDVSY